MTPSMTPLALTGLLPAAARWRAALALLLLAGASALPRPAVADEVVLPPETVAALQAVDELAQINGRALACGDADNVRRAKNLMLLHAPRTARFGQAFDEGTQAAFLGVTRGERACPATEVQTRRVAELALRLQALLPPAAAAGAASAP